MPGARPDMMMQWPPGIPAGQVNWDDGMEAPELTQDVAAMTEAPQSLDLAQLASDLWRHRWLLLALLLLSLAVASVYLRVATYRYTATLQVTPTEQQGPSIPGGLASLGSVVGIDVGGMSGSSYALFGEALKSQPVADALARDPRIMRTIFRAQWDAGNEQWRRAPSPLRPVTAPVKAILGVPDQPWRAPDAVNLREALHTRLVVSEDRKKNITTLSFEHDDPAFAAYLLTRAAAEADSYLRERSLKRSSDYIAYLEQRLADTAIAEQRLALARSLMQYENVRMMASVESPYAGEPFGRVNVSDRPTSPQPLVALGLAVVVSFATWFGYVVLLRPLFGQLRARRLPN